MDGERKHSLRLHLTEVLVLAPGPPCASPVVLELSGGCWTPSGGRWLRAWRELLRGAHTGPTMRRGVGELKPSDFVSEAGGQSGRGVCPAGPAGGSRGATTTQCQSTIGQSARVGISNSSVVVPLHAALLVSGPR